MPGAAHLAKTGCLIVGEVRTAVRKIPTDVALAATDPERGLLARQAILLPRCRLWYRRWPRLPAIKSRAGAL